MHLIQHTLPWTHLSPQHKQHLDRFSHYRTSHGRVSSSVHGMSSPLKFCLFVWGDLDPHLITVHGSTGPPESIQPKRHLDRFSHFSQLMAVSSGIPGMSFIPKIRLRMGCEAPFNTWLLGPTRVQISNSISIDSAYDRESLYFSTGRPFPP